MDDDELLRYSRQIMLPELDIAGQELLLEATVLIVGLGGLGSPIAMYLAAAGVGKLILNDHDQVDLSNLQRQIVHSQASIGASKVESASARLKSLNPGTELELISEKLCGQSLSETVARSTIVVDATDNFQVRYQLNQACFEEGVALVSGAAIRWEGQVAIFDPTNPDSPCYRCLYAAGDDAALNCSESGVAAPLVGIIGSCQAMEALKMITGIGDTLVGYVLYFDAKRMDWRKLKLPKNPDCPVCGN
jgi:molybdopterin/thiamine biosynthesis adenylyltransferase